MMDDEQPPHMVLTEPIWVLSWKEPLPYTGHKIKAQVTYE